MNLGAVQARWTKADLEYLRLLATTLLALVLLPLVLAHLVLHPFEAADHAVANRIV